MQNAKSTLASKMERSGHHTPVDKYQMKGLSKVLQYLLELKGFENISDVPLEVGDDFTIDTDNVRKLVDDSKELDEILPVHFEWDHESLEGKACKQFKYELGKHLYPRLSQALEVTTNQIEQNGLYVNAVKTDRREANRFSHPNMNKFSVFVRY